MSSTLLILTGKTASGKDTVMTKLLSKLSNFRKVTTTTSRTPRSGEKEGIDYHFISASDFKRKIEARDFIEYVEYGGNLYGTEKSQITDNLKQNLIWRIDPSRAGQIRKFVKDSFDSNLAEDLLKRVIVIYLTVTDDVVLKRLTERGLSKEEIEKRMQEDAKFWQEFRENYDYVVENVPGKLDETVNNICQILTA